MTPIKKFPEKQKKIEKGPSEDVVLIKNLSPFRHVLGGQIKIVDRSYSEKNFTPIKTFSEKQEKIEKRK